MESVATIRKPRGQTTRDTLKHDTFFSDEQAVVEGRPYKFERDSYWLTIDTSDVKHTVYICKNCRGMLERNEGQRGQCGTFVKAGASPSPGTGDRKPAQTEGQPRTQGWPLLSVSDD